MFSQRYNSHIITVGTTLTITTGSYSDYRDNGPFIVLKSIDRRVVSEAFLDAWRAIPHEDWQRPTGDDFITWLNREDFIEYVHGAVSWHAGDYDFEPEFES